MYNIDNYYKQVGFQITKERNLLQWFIALVHPISCFQKIHLAFAQDVLENIPCTYKDFCRSLSRAWKIKYMFITTKGIKFVRKFRNWKEKRYRHSSIGVFSVVLRSQLKFYFDNLSCLSVQIFIMLIIKVKLFMRKQL